MSSILRESYLATEITAATLLDVLSDYLTTLADDAICGKSAQCGRCPLAQALSSVGCSAVTVRRDVATLRFSGVYWEISLGAYASASNHAEAAVLYRFIERIDRDFRYGSDVPAVEARTILQQLRLLYEV
jgi:hypothetical protein